MRSGRWKTDGRRGDAVTRRRGEDGVYSGATPSRLNALTPLRLNVAWLILLALLFCATAVRAQSTAPSVPEGFQGATVVDKPNAAIPLELPFVDEDGKTVHLRDFFASGRPVILVMVYYGCPMLCNLTLNGLTEGLRPMKLSPGTDYQVVAVSFNPEEKPDLARAKKANYLKSLDRAGGEAGWHFLTGSADNAQALGDAIGFGFRRTPDGQYLHQAAIYVCTPDGRVARTIGGVQFEPELLNDSLVNASQGQVASGIFRLAISCGLYHFDAASGKYVIVAQRLVQLGALLTLLGLGALLGTFWYREARRRPASEQAGPKTS